MTKMLAKKKTTQPKAARDVAKPAEGNLQKRRNFNEMVTQLDNHRNTLKSVLEGLRNINARIAGLSHDLNQLNAQYQYECRSRSQARQHIRKSSCIYHCVYYHSSQLQKGLWLTRNVVYVGDSMVANLNNLQSRIQTEEAGRRRLRRSVRAATTLVSSDLNYFDQVQEAERRGYAVPS